jgi:hypothetical protein
VKIGDAVAVHVDAVKEEGMSFYIGVVREVRKGDRLEVRWYQPKSRVYSDKWTPDYLLQGNKSVISCDEVGRSDVIPVPIAWQDNFTASKGAHLNACCLSLVEEWIADQDFFEAQERERKAKTKKSKAKKK